MVILDTVDTLSLRPGIILSSEVPGSSTANLINVCISWVLGKFIIVTDVEFFKSNAPESPYAPGSPVTKKSDVTVSKGETVSID